MKFKEITQNLELDNECLTSPKLLEFKKEEKGILEIREDCGCEVKFASLLDLSELPKSKEVMNGRYRIEALRSCHLDKDTLREMSDFFRYIFYNNQDHLWGQYACCPDCDNLIAASDVYPNQKGELGDKNYDVPLEIIGAAPFLPNCRDCSEQMYLHQEPERTFQLFAEKFKNPGWITLLRDVENNKLAGMMFGYKASLKKAFKMEEWEDPYYYADIPTELRAKKLRLFENFRISLSRAVKNRSKKGGAYCQYLCGDTEFLIINCIALSRKNRGRGGAYELAGNLFNLIPDEYYNHPVLTEGVIGNTMYKLLLRGGAVPLEQMAPEYNEGDSVLMTFTIENMLLAFSDSQTN